MPRLPSALGLSGAMRCGGQVWTLDPPLSALTLTPLSPLTPYRPLPLSPLHSWQLPAGEEEGWTAACTTSILSIRWVERGSSQP
eukprot:scaffold2653_cov111-Isochrysis_galbana.AAC.4